MNSQQPSIKRMKRLSALPKGEAVGMRKSTHFCNHQS
jgi:hypothetical protein